MKSIIAVLALSLVLSGCATNGGLSEGGKAALREVAVIGMNRYLREHADTAKVERIRTVLLELQALPDITTVDGLKAAVQLRIDPKVGDPQERQEFTSLLQILSPLLEQYVGKGDLAPEQVVKVRDFLAYLVAALPAG